MQFSTLEQRLAYTYLDTFPAFQPDSAGVSIEAQRQFYDLIRGVYQLAFDQPLLWVTTLHEDDAFPRHMTKKAYGKPELERNMKKFTKEMDALLKAMFALGADSQSVRLTKRQAAILDALGIDPQSPCEGWRWMATRDGATLAAFSHCFFDRDYRYVSDLYARLLGNEAAYRRLERWLLDHGYRYHHCLNVTASDDPITMTYANPAWGEGTPSGGFEYKVRHTGIACRYDAYSAAPAIMGLCIPGGMKRYLSAFDEMDGRVQAFVFERTAKCNGCGYCVQTDKTGTRPRAYITLEHDGKRGNLCTYFPGYRYSWTALDDALTDNLIAMLTFMDSMLPA